MFFALSKILGALVEPAHLITLILLIAWWLQIGQRSPRRRAACWLTGGIAWFLVAVAATPLADLAAIPLENRFQRPVPMPGRVDGIIVLGGATSPVISAARGEAELNAAADRLFATMELARTSPSARIIATGGSGSLIHPDLTEDVPTRRLFVQMDISPSRFLLENRSRNTRENALFSKATLDDATPGEKVDGTWLLVTSAAHMPRAVGVFRRIGWPVIPYPVDYRTEGTVTWSPQLDLLENLVVLSGALREWIGLVVYHFRGWTDDWFPAPEQGDD